MKVLYGIFAAVLLLLLPAFCLAQTDMPRNDVEVRFDLEKNLVTGVSRITLPAGESAKISLSGIRVTDVAINDTKLVIESGTESLNFKPAAAEDITEDRIRGNIRGFAGKRQHEKPRCDSGQQDQSRGNYADGRLVPGGRGIFPSPAEGCFAGWV